MGGFKRFFFEIPHSRGYLSEITMFVQCFFVGPQKIWEDDFDFDLYMFHKGSKHHLSSGYLLLYGTRGTYSYFHLRKVVFLLLKNQESRE